MDPGLASGWAGALVSRQGVLAVLANPWTRRLIFAMCLLPALMLVAGAALERLGANPAQYLTRATGDWTLRMLCLTLAVTPLRVGLGLPPLARWRRMLGLYVFFYAVLHLLCYAWFDMGFDWADIARDIPKRPFVLLGFAAFVLLVPLALTSLDRMVRALGAKRWRALHRSVYGIAVLVVLHFLWLRAGKNDFAEPAIYGAVLGALLAWRIKDRWGRRRAG